MGVAVNPPKSPVTEGSNTIAAATLPNICKMPGPPAPFVPTPLPNIGKGSNSPQGYSTTVTIEGDAVAIQGATFNSMGDVASQGTGGGLVSMNVQGPTSFIAPGSLDVKIEGKNVQLLGDQMLNNGGPSGSPANSATMGGALHKPLTPAQAEKILQDICCKCDKEVNEKHKKNPSPATDCCSERGNEKHECCDKALKEVKGVDGERGYNKDGSPYNGGRAQRPSESWGQYQGRIRGKAFPDACLLSQRGNPKRFYDFKFACPAGVPKWINEKTGAVGPPAPGGRPQMIGPKQEEKYTVLAKKRNMKDTTPKMIANTTCPP